MVIKIFSKVTSAMMASKAKGMSPLLYRGVSCYLKLGGQVVYVVPGLPGGTF